MCLECILVNTLWGGGVYLWRCAVSGLDRGQPRGGVYAVASHGVRLHQRLQDVAEYVSVTVCIAMIVVQRFRDEWI